MGRDMPVIIKTATAIKTKRIMRVPVLPNTFAKRPPTVAPRIPPVLPGVGESQTVLICSLKVTVEKYSLLSAKS